MEKGKKTRISLDLSPSAFDRLSSLELITDSSSKADLIREALRLYEYLVRQSVSFFTITATGQNSCDCDSRFMRL